MSKKWLVCNYPYVAIYNDFLTEHECDHIISLCENNMYRSRVITEKGTTEVSDRRTSSQTRIELNTDHITQCVTDKVCKMINISQTHAETIQVVKYEQGQEYKSHCDAFEKNIQGQRLYTVLCYLNNVEKGGETVFPNLGLKIPPRAGRIVVFQNIDQRERDKPLVQSMHASLPVINGIKWACNFWFQDKERSS